MGHSVRRTLPWILVGVGIIFIVLVVMLMRITGTAPRSKGDPQQQLIPDAQPALSGETVYTAEAIARSAIKFLNTQRRADHFYHFFSHYDTICPDPPSAATCPLEGRNVMEQANAWTILGRLGYYRAFSHDRADLAIAQADAQALATFCMNKGNACPTAPLAIAALFEETKDETYRTLLTTLASQLSDTSNLDVVGLTFQARSLFALANVFPDGSYANLARQHLAQAEAQAAQDQKDSGEQQFACFLTLAKIEAAEQSGSFPELEEIAAEFLSATLTQMPSSTNLRAGCIESAYILGDLLGNEQIQKRGEELVEQLVIERWDEPGYPRLWGEGGFLYEDAGTAVTTADTGHMLWILAGRPQHTYRFPFRKNI